MITGVILSGLAFAPVTANDTFFGLKIGEVIVQTRQIPTQELFSWSAYGRPWIAYEWLAQTGMYLLKLVGGFSALSVFVSLSFGLFYLLLFLLFSRALKRDFASSYALSVFTSIGVLEFFVARPQIVAFVGFIATLYLIFLFLLERKNRLLWLIPLTYVWTNSHASFIMLPLLLFAYALFGFWYLRLTERPWAKSAAKTCGLYGLLSLGITLLPPLWYKPYTLLWQFGRDLAFISGFILEWGALAKNPTHEMFYVFLVVSVLIAAVVLAFFRKNWSRWLLAFPLLAISLTSFQALRHISFGTISLVIILGLFLPNLRFRGRRTLGAVVFFMLIFTFSCYLGWQKRPNENANWFYLPEQTIDFLKHHQLRGRMYNEFALGGYLMYYLYPQYQIFFDGRAEVYHYQEMRDVWPLIGAKRSSQEIFRRAVDTLLNKYHFSYLVIPYPSYNPLEFTSSTLMADALMDDPYWSLIYTSDRVQVLVARDGKNADLISGFGLSAATPYRLKPYRPGQIEQARSDYLRLVNTLDSGVARNALGEIYFELGEEAQAQEAWNRAIALNPLLGKPYLGLAKISLKHARPAEAVRELEKALELEPYLGQAYLLLGQTLETGGQKNRAVGIWQQGLKERIDLVSYQKIVEAMSRASAR